MIMAAVMTVALKELELSRWRLDVTHEHMWDSYTILIFV